MAVSLARNFLRQNKVMLKSIVGGAGILAVGKGLFLILSLIIAANASKTVFGSYSFIIATSNLLGLLAALGFSASLLRFVPAYEANADKAFLGGLFTFSLRLVLLSSVILGSVFVAVGTISDIEKITFVGCLIPFVSYRLWRVSFVRGLGKTAIALLPYEIFFPLAMLIIVTVFMDLQSLSDLMFAALAVLLIGELVGSVAFADLARKTNWTQRQYARKTWKKISLTLLVIAISRLSLERVDIIFLGFLASPTDLADYAFAVQLVWAISFSLIAVSLIMAPQFSKIHTEHGLPAVWKELKKGIFLSSGLTIVGALIVVFSSPIIIDIVNSEYKAAIGILYILTIGAVVNGVSGPCAYALTMTGYEREVSKLVLIVASLNALAVGPMYLTLGVYGVAMTSTASVTLFNVATFFMARKILRPQSSITPPL